MVHFTMDQNIIAQSGFNFVFKHKWAILTTCADIADMFVTAHITTGSKAT